MLIFIILSKFNSFLVSSGELTTNCKNSTQNHKKIMSRVTSDASHSLTSSVSLPVYSDISASIIELCPDCSALSPAFSYNKTMFTDVDNASA